MDRPLVYDDVRSDLCPALVEIFLAMEAASGGTAASNNRGGWKSRFIINDDEPPALVVLRRAIVARVGERPPARRKVQGPAIISWAMINRKGAEHPRHHHSGVPLTCVYFVTSGNPPIPTCFECQDGTELPVAPVPGRLVICLGDMWHRVPAYPGEEPRITLITDVQS